MSQVDETLESQVIAVGLLPLLKEYTQKMIEIGTSARRLQRLHAKAKFDLQLQQNRLPGTSMGVGLRDAADTRARIDKEQKVIQRAQSDFENVRFAFNRLHPSSEDLARQASQLVEHAKLEPVTRLELALRLADFESALRQAKLRIAAGLTG